MLQILRFVSNVRRHAQWHVCRTNSENSPLNEGEASKHNCRTRSTLTRTKLRTPAIGERNGNSDRKRKWGYAGLRTSASPSRGARSPRRGAQPADGRAERSAEREYSLLGFNVCLCFRLTAHVARRASDFQPKVKRSWL